MIQLPRTGNYFRGTCYLFRRDHCWICGLRGGGPRFSPVGWLQGWHMKRVVRKMP